MHRVVISTTSDKVKGICLACAQVVCESVSMRDGEDVYHSYRRAEARLHRTFADYTCTPVQAPNEVASY